MATQEWEKAIDAFERKIEKRIKDIHAKTAFAIRDSVKDGSAVTGAPGQPVDTGNLKNSWQLAFPSQLLARLTTNVEYAPGIEEGVGPSGPMTLQSPVGGFHSVKLTRASFQGLVDAVVREVIRND